MAILADTSTGTTPQPESIIEIYTGRDSATATTPLLGVAVVATQEETQCPQRVKAMIAYFALFLAQVLNLLFYLLFNRSGTAVGSNWACGAIMFFLLGVQIAVCVKYETY